MNEPKKRKLSDIMLRWEFKFTVTILLLMFAFTGYAQTPDRAHTLCFFAMLFSTFGDLLLMDYMGIPQYIFKGKQLYAGGLAFAISHVFYRQMFRSMLIEKTIFGLGEIITIVLIICILIVVYNTKQKKITNVFFAAIGLYTSFILSNLAAAINCAQMLGGKYVFSLIGVICFIISDILLLIRETKKDTPMIRKLVWVFYPIAQILIIMNV